MKGIIERGVPGVKWISFLDQNGKRRKEKVGREDAALEMLGIRKREVKSGKYTPPRAERLWSFEKLANHAINQKSARLAESTIATDRTRLSKLVPLIGASAAKRLTSERIDEVLGILKASGLKNSTCNRFRSFISGVYRHAITIGQMTMNPVAAVKRFPEKGGRVRWLTPEEQKSLLLELTEEQEAEVLLAVETGMRRGEQFGLTWKNTDLENGLLHVDGKSGPRVVKVNAKARAAIETLRRFSGDDHKVTPAANKKRKAKRDWRSWFRTACRKAGVKDFVWHDLRHTFASRLAMNGVPLLTIMALMGHSDIKMTQRYAHLSKDHTTRAVEKTGTPGGRR